MDEISQAHQIDTPTKYINAVLRTEHTPSFIKTKHGAEHDRMLERCVHAIFGMMTELGELTDKFKKHLIYERQLDVVGVVEELGDQDWYRGLIADALKVGFEEAWTKNIAKLRARYPEKFTFEAEANRDLSAERAALEGDRVIRIIMFGPPYDRVIAYEQRQYTVRGVVGNLAAQLNLQHMLTAGWEAYCESGVRLDNEKPLLPQLKTDVLQITRPAGWGG